MKCMFININKDIDAINSYTNTLKNIVFMTLKCKQIFENTPKK